MRKPDRPMLDALVRNVYTSPSLERLRRRSPDVCLMFGEFRVTDVEIKTGMTDERAFMALLSARLESTLDEMAEFLRAPTIPVHDHLSWKAAA